MSSQRKQFENLEILRVGRFPGKINTTCIVYRLGCTLIDTGPPNQWKEVKKFIYEKDVKQICITHHHEDHSGNTAQIQEATSAQVFAHHQGCKWMKNGWYMEPYRHLIWGRPTKFEAQTAPSKLNLDNNLSLNCISTPGHSDDSLCFLEPNKGWLFTGDLYITSHPHSLRIDENPHEQIKSLEYLLNLEFEFLMCAHRGVVKNGKNAINNKLKYLKELRDEIIYLDSKGVSQTEIRKRLLGRETLVSLLTLFNFCKQNFVRNMILYNN